MKNHVRFVVAAVLALAGCPQEQINEAARSAGVTGIAPVGSSTPVPTTGAPESALERVSSFLNNALSRCRTNEPGFGPQIPPDAAGDEVLGTGLWCPQNRITEKGKPVCTDTMTFDADFSTTGLRGTSTNIARVVVTVTKNQVLEHDHQLTTCDNPGRCAAQYVSWYAEVDSDLTVTTSATVAGTAINLDVTAAFGSSKRNYSFKMKRDHEGPRECGRAACEPGGSGAGGSSGMVPGGGACEVPGHYACPDGRTGDCCRSPNDCPAGCEVW